MQVIEDMLKHIPKAALFLIVAAVLSSAAVPLKAEEKKNLISSRYSDVLLKAQEKTREGNNKEALSLLEPFISDPEKYPVAISDYIVILVWEERFNEAINIYESLPPLFVKRPYVVRNAAKAYYEKREFSKALSLYQRLLDQTPSDSEVQKGVIYCLIQAGDLDAASAYLDKFLTASPDSLPLSLIKAELLFRQNRYSEALSYTVCLRKGIRSTGNLFTSHART
jgi:predicted Zn-dependent protease